MASLSARLRAVLRSSQGQRLLARAQEVVAHPANQRRLEQLRTRLNGRRPR